MKISIEKIPYSRFDVVKEIRKKIFEELGIDKDSIFDSDDKSSDQILIMLRDIPIGTARLQYDEKIARLERMGILKKYRKNGYGRLAMEKIILYCKSKKMKRIILHSIYDVKGFYQKSGFRETGSVFTRVGIPHVTMYVDLILKP